MSHWIFIDRQYSEKGLAVGPYETEEQAEFAMNNALIIDALCEKDCLDAFILEGEPKLSEVDLIRIDPDDPDYTGVGRKETEDELTLLFIETEKETDND